MMRLFCAMTSICWALDGLIQWKQGNTMGMVGSALLAVSGMSLAVLERK